MNKHFFPKIYANIQQAHAKIFTIIGLQENENQLQWDTTLHPLGWLSPKSKVITNIDEEIGTLIHDW